MPPEMWAIVASLITGLILKIGDSILNRGKEKREIRHDLREEVIELWDRLDDQDKRLAEKDTEIATLKNQVATLDYYKQRYQTAALEIESLQRQLKTQQQHITKLESEMAALKASRNG